MRVYLPLLIVLMIGLVVFLATNSEEHVTINLGTRSVPEVPLWQVVFGAFAIGAGLVAIVSVLDGLGLRLANRRMRRELHRLETEIHFLRTQTPAAATRDAPLAPPATEVAAQRVGLPKRDEYAGDALPHAPVYGPEDEDDEL